MSSLLSIPSSPTANSFKISSSTTNPTTLSDKNLYHLCQEYGRSALLWRRKFAGLLPEVNRRELYKKKGFSTIFHFAAQLAGMSQESVRLVLNLEKQFSDKPHLHEALTQGEASP